MVASLQLQPFGRTAHPATLGTIEVGSLGRLMQRRIDLKDLFPDGRQVDYLFKCRDCKHNGGKDRTCIGDKRAIMCADCAYALPDDHEPRNIATDKLAQSVR